MISAEMYDGGYDDPAPPRPAPPPAQRIVAVKEPLSLKDAFSYVNGTMENPVTLRAYTGGIYNYYDFAQRLRVTNGQNPIIVPFTEIDRDVLVAARDKLVELGGQPPQLAPEANALNKPLRGLNP
ncbi:MAG: hypothetical protein PSY14_11125 [bacterium]|nr:hypothetical protein [bacterium]